MPLRNKTVFELFLDLAKGVAGNATYDWLKRIFLSGKVTQEAVIQQEKPVEERKHFYVFDLTNDFEPMLKTVNSPIVHIVVEDKPTTAWHLPVIILESSTTNEWYVFAKGSLAFEGSGGGLSNAKWFLTLLKDNNVPVVGWVSSKEFTDKLGNGMLHWSVLKTQLWPLMSYIEKPYIQQFISSVFSELKKH